MALNNNIFLLGDELNSLVLMRSVSISAICNWNLLVVNKLLFGFSEYNIKVFQKQTPVCGIFKIRKRYKNKGLALHNS